MPDISVFLENLVQPALHTFCNLMSLKKNMNSRNLVIVRTKSNLQNSSLSSENKHFLLRLQVTDAMHRVHFRFVYFEPFFVAAY